MQIFKVLFSFVEDVFSEELLDEALLLLAAAVAPGLGGVAGQEAVGFVVAVGAEGCEVGPGVHEAAHGGGVGGGLDGDDVVDEDGGDGAPGAEAVFAQGLAGELEAAQATPAGCLYEAAVEGVAAHGWSLTE